MKALRNTFGYILLVFLVYVLVNDPFWIPTFGILGRGSRQHSIYMLAIVSIIYTLVRMSDFRNFIRLFQTELTLIILLIVFALICHRTLTGLDFASHIDMLLQSYIIPFFLISYAIKKVGIDNDISFIRVVLIMSVVGAILTTLCLLIPSFDLYVKNVILQFTDEDKAAGYSFRSFGVARSLLFGYGTAQGIAMALGILYYRENRWYMFCVPLVFVSIMFNARTGLLIPFVSLLINLFVSRRKVVGWGLLLFLGVLFFYSRGFLALFNENSDDWLNQFFNEIFGVIQTGNLMSSETANVLLTKHIIWPSDFGGWFFGTGIDLARSNIGHSDVGFIRQLHYGGIVYCGLLYGLILFMVRRLRRFGYKSVSTLFLFAFIICNLKGLFAPVSSGFVLLTLVYFYLIYYSKTIKPQIVLVQSNQ